VSERDFLFLFLRTLFYLKKKVITFIFLSNITYVYSRCKKIFDKTHTLYSILSKNKKLLWFTTDSMSHNRWSTETSYFCLFFKNKFHDHDIKNGTYCLRYAATHSFFYKYLKALIYMKYYNFRFFEYFVEYVVYENRVKKN